MTAKIKLNAASGGGSISIQAPSSSSNNRIISLPDIADGTLLTSQSSLDSTKLSPAISAGITMADMWRMSASHVVATTNTTISSNWERVDSNSFAQIGTGLTESSGYFSFPQTGIYQIDWHAQLHNSTNNERYVYNQIYITTDNSSYNQASFGSAGMGTDSHRAQIDIKCIFDVTDISTDKFYITEYSYNGNTSMYGGSTINYSYLTVIRLGDT